MQKKHKKKRVKKSRATKQRRPNALAQVTAAYFVSLSGEVLEEERRLEAAITSTPGHIDFEADHD